MTLLHPSNPTPPAGELQDWPKLPPCGPGPAIVLVAPAGPLNIGSVARVMRNFGLDDLRLVNPRTDPLHADARRMAMRACMTLERAKRQTFSSLAEALHDAHTVVATSARMAQGGARGPTNGPPCLEPHELFGGALPNLVPGNANILGPGTAFVFGNEESGLSIEERLHAHLLLTVPTDASFASLNLAQAVGLVCYEISRANRLSDRGHASQPVQSHHQPVAAGHLLAELQDQTARWLLAIGFLQPLTERARMRQLALVIRRCRLSVREAHLLLAVVRFAHSRMKPRSQSPKKSCDADDDLVQHPTVN